jgi:ribosomal protein L12E/L44/L45/RPP1/RPP2
MKYIAAYALLVLGGKTDIKAADIENVLKEGGIKADADHSNKLITALSGKAFHELVSEGTKKMSSVSAAPSGGAPAAGGKP